MAIKQKDGKWIVTNEAGDKILGEHDTEQEALKQLQAIEASKFEDCGCTRKEDGSCGCDNFLFADAAVLSLGTRKINSIRDGVYQYLGAEIGQEPAFKIFNIYRSPATVAKLVPLLDGLPITDGHVNINFPATDVVSTVKDTTLLAEKDDDLASSVIIQNDIADSDSVVSLFKQGKQELSLAGKAKLIDHEIYDFEQIDIEPHHIAMLKRGRCGDACRFQDSQLNTGQVPMLKLTKLIISFADQDGDVTMEQIMEMVTAMPEAMKTLPVDKLKELADPMKEIMETAKSSGVEMDEIEDAGMEEEEIKDQDPEKAEAARGSTALGDLIAAERGDVTNEQIAEAAGRDLDTIENIISGNIKTPPREVLEGIGRAINVSVDRLIDALPDEKEEEVEVEDQEPSDEEKIAMADGKILFNDEQVQAREKAAVANHSNVIEHARKFVDESYDFTGKSSKQIQRDVLGQFTDQEFKDEELDVAFKMLNTGSGKYTDFADKSASDKIDETFEKEI